MALSYSSGTEKMVEDSRYPLEIKGIVVGTVIPNPDNEDEFLFIAPKDYIPNWTYKDYVNAGAKPAKRE